MNHQERFGANISRSDTIIEIGNTKEDIQIKPTGGEEANSSSLTKKRESNRFTNIYVLWKPVEQDGSKLKKTESHKPNIESGLKETPVKTKRAAESPAEKEKLKKKSMGEVAWEKSSKTSQTWKKRYEFNNGKSYRKNFSDEA